MQPVKSGLRCDSLEVLEDEELPRWKCSIKRLSTLQSHDALCLLKNSIAMPKLLYILRTSPCANNPLLQQFDMVLKNALKTMLNVQLSDTQRK